MRTNVLLSKHVDEASPGRRWCPVSQSPADGPDGVPPVGRVLRRRARGARRRPAPSSPPCWERRSGRWTSSMSGSCSGGFGRAAAARARGLRGGHGGRGVRPPPGGAAGGVEGARGPGPVAGRGVPGRGARLRDDRQRLQRRPAARHGRQHRRPAPVHAGRDGGGRRSTGTAPGSSATPPCTCPTTWPPRPTRSSPTPPRRCGWRTCSKKAARLEARLDPEGVQRRKDEARHDRRVELRRRGLGRGVAGGPGARPGRGAGGEGVDRRRGGPAPQRGPARHPGPDPGAGPAGPDPPAQPLGPPRPAAPEPEPDARRRRRDPGGDPGPDGDDDFGGRRQRLPRRPRRLLSALTTPATADAPDDDDDDDDDRRRKRKTKRTRAARPGSTARRPAPRSTRPAARPRCPP